MPIDGAGGIVLGIIELNDRHSGPIESGAQFGGCDGRDRHGIGEHELQPRVRHGGIDR
ncbi:Uncharacterised protein [Mycobacteroides abscessus subsp. massiliense]|nr:Uncharacterised protein [Mycobacteroides abscessus subsp. massiliense]